MARKSKKLKALPSKQYEGNRLTIIEHARTIAAEHDENQELDGFIVIGWNSGGQFSLGLRNEGNGIPPRLLPSWVAEIVREATLTSQTADEIIRGYLDED